MKLSEAIRLGAMLKPQGHDLYLHHGRTCALGAAFDAIGRLDDLLAASPLCAESVFPLLGCLAKHPIGKDTLPVSSLVFRLNDIDHWTREQIADWVSTIEAQQLVSQLETVCAD